MLLLAPYGRSAATIIHFLQLFKSFLLISARLTLFSSESIDFILITFLTMITPTNLRFLSRDAKEFSLA